MDVREVLHYRLVVAVLAAVGGAVVALVLAGAGDWRDVVLVLVTGAATLAAAEATGAREARRRAEDRAHADAQGALTGELELEKHWLELTVAHVTNVVTVDLYLRQGKGDAASALAASAAANPLDPATVPDLTYLADVDLHRRFMAALIDSQDGLLARDRGEDTRGSVAQIAELAKLTADLSVLLRTQQRRLARREHPVRLQLSGEDLVRHQLEAQRMAEQLEAAHKGARP